MHRAITVGDPVREQYGIRWQSASIVRVSEARVGERNAAQFRDQRAPGSGCRTLTVCNKAGLRLRHVDGPVTIRPKRKFVMILRVFDPAVDAPTIAKLLVEGDGDLTAARFDALFSVCREGASRG